MDLKATEIDVEHLNTVYKDLAQRIGIDKTLEIYEIYSGCQVVFPKKLYSPEYISQIIAKEYNGNNARELAKKYDYTERSIRRILNK